jgi:hypothetical protein
MGMCTCSEIKNHSNRVDFPVPRDPRRKKLFDFIGFRTLWNILHKYTLFLEYA